MLITRLWKSQPGRYFFLSTKSASGKWKDHAFDRKELGKVEEFLKQNSDKDIYFCPHGFSKPQRLKEFAELPKLLWSDLDEADPHKIKFKPTIAIESSPGRFVGLWTLDRTMEESLNRRLSHSLENADPGGWDLTQVLRVPGTRNYKYESSPRVRLLWSDGPEYTKQELSIKLPPDDEEEGNEGDGPLVSEVFRKYQRTMPHWVRRELMNGKPTPGKRSEMLWKLENALLETGLSEDEAFVLIKASPWNKFAGRRNEDKQLRSELSKATDRHLKGRRGKDTVRRGSEEKNGHAAAYHFLSRSMDEVQEEEIDWIWYPYLARGELTILEGDPGLGKSYLAQMVSGFLCDGRRLPSIKKTDPVEGKVAYFDIENSAGSITKKRLVGNGVENLGNFFQDEEPFSIDDPDRLEEVYDAIEGLKPTLVVFDTLNTYIGRADTHKSSESQQAFATFRDIAKRFKCSVMVLRHLTKSSKERAIYRGQGSIAFTGLARVVMTVGVSPEDSEVRVVAVTKLNVTKKPKALTFQITEVPDTLKEKDRSKFKFGEFIDISADEMLTSVPKEDNTGREEAERFLRDVLDEGPVEGRKIEKMAEARSIPMKMVNRVAEELGVLKDVKGFGKARSLVWTMPD